MSVCITSGSFNAIAYSAVDLSIGLEHNSGSYGLTDDTDITEVPVFAQYRQDAWRFRLTIPYISVTGDGTVIPGTKGVFSSQNIPGPITGTGSGGPPSVSTTSVRETQSGLGDISTSISYALPPRQDSPMFYELTGSVKWGTASTKKNLGTGENDYSLSLYSIYQRYDLKPYLTLGYLVIGDTSAIDYNDVIYTTAGLMYQTSPVTFITAAYDFQQATLDSIDDGHTLGLYVNTRVNRNWYANIYLLNGLSDSVADSGIGLSLMRSY